MNGLIFGNWSEPQFILVLYHVLWPSFSTWYLFLLYSYFAFVASLILSAVGLLPLYNRRQWRLDSSHISLAQQLQQKEKFFLWKWYLGSWESLRLVLLESHSLSPNSTCQDDVLVQDLGAVIIPLVDGWLARAFAWRHHWNHLNCGVGSCSQRNR